MIINIIENTREKTGALMYTTGVLVHNDVDKYNTPGTVEIIKTEGPCVK